MARSANLRVKNKTGATLTANTVVYLNGVVEELEDAVNTVGVASNNDPNKMPAVGVIRDDILNNEIGIVKITGALAGLNTSGVAVNSAVYVGLNGSITFRNPSELDTAAIVQQIGTVSFVGIEDGQIYLFPLEVQTKHATTHKPAKSDPFLHATQHELGGADEVGHGSLDGLGDDTHTQYTLVDGSRAFTGVVSSPEPTEPTHLATKNYVDEHSSAANIYGDGSDGTALTFDGSSVVVGLTPAASVYTMTRDLYLGDFTIDSGVRLSTANFRLFGNGTGTINGSVSCNGGNGASAVLDVGGTPGGSTPAAGTVGGGAAGTFGGTGTTGAGAAGGAQAVQLVGEGGNGGSGGAGGTGANGGGSTQTGRVITVAKFRTLSPIILRGAVVIQAGEGGTGGASGGGDGATGKGGGGGAGGAGGGTCFVWVNTLVLGVSGAIQSNGGNGGNGGNGAGGVNAGGGGGGGSGAGGFVYCVTDDVSTADAAKIVANHGTHGTGGSGSGSGVPGSDGGDGGNGTRLVMNRATGEYL